MRRALSRWREVYDGDHTIACRAAAELLADDPWRVVEVAGALARAQVVVLDMDTGVGERLQRLKPDSARAVAVFSAGEPFPVLDLAGRKRRGAWDTPRQMARGLARACGDDVLDPACGPGAFLLAAKQAGASRIRGWDLDQAALAVASVAVPEAHLERCSAFERDEGAEVVLCNPPFVSAEHQDKVLRARLSERFDWLRGRFDLAVPFLAHAVELATRRAALVLPSSLASQPYAAALRRRWLASHRLMELSSPTPFEGAGVEVVLATWAIGEGPAPMPWDPRMEAGELLALDNAPLDRALEHGDPGLVEHMRRHAVTLGTLCEVDTGVVAHGPKGGKARLLSDQPGGGRVPYVDARDLLEGRRRWLDYRPRQMHRAKRPALFEGPKILVQRLRGPHPVRAVIDLEGLYAGHTLTVVRPMEDMDLDRLLTLLRSPLVDGLLRIEGGARLDLYPNVIKGLPVPSGWLDGDDEDLVSAFGLSASQTSRLVALASRRRRL
ncbi:MAG TPA: methyltransferase [Myxococcota bacterium]|nr:methyltransferase [Myxococcota bacterium]